MTERPIPFSAPMVRAILAGTKSQTRRVVKEPGWAIPGSLHLFNGRLWAADPHQGDRDVACPYGQPGDRLWVREAWRVAAVHDHVPGSELGFAPLPQVQYEAIGDGRDETGVQWGRYRHARFMPRWASRITLEVTGVRVERLQDISEADALAEGVRGYPFRPDDGWPICTGYMVGADDGKTTLHPKPQDPYRLLWDQINGAGSWDANPWVWVLDFKRTGGKG